MDARGSAAAQVVEGAGAGGFGVSRMSGRKRTARVCGVCYYESRADRSGGT